MEIADFIHLDLTGGSPLLTLIHVKGSKSDMKDRGISVSDYEVVVGQAVKNIRFLDRLNLAEGLQAGLDKEIGRLVWRDGELSTREEMLAALGAIGASFRRRVVVLQPRVRRDSLQEVRDDLDHKDTARLRQLDTLFHGAAASCRDLGAEFIVLGEAI